MYELPSATILNSVVGCAVVQRGYTKKSGKFERKETIFSPMVEKSRERVNEHEAILFSGLSSAVRNKIIDKEIEDKVLYLHGYALWKAYVKNHPHFSMAPEWIGRAKVGRAMYKKTSVEEIVIMFYLLYSDPVWHSTALIFAGYMAKIYPALLGKLQLTNQEHIQYVLSI